MQTDRPLVIALGRRLYGYDIGDCERFERIVDSAQNDGVELSIARQIMRTPGVQRVLFVLDRGVNHVEVHVDSAVYDAGLIMRAHPRLLIATALAGIAVGYLLTPNRHLSFIPGEWRPGDPIPEVQL